MDPYILPPIESASWLIEKVFKEDTESANSFKKYVFYILFPLKVNNKNKVKINSMIWEF